ncbi:MAG: TlpA family protein disulfide reductase [Kofleriaceae bacterium]|jgi:cytochrome c biogenesis protein CcmG/thiol:disulfide interchange protein DsbE|nr:TlpA family protein disulfide reductase [Kofleriaceae bacterium]MBP6840900.1 TlpA family protein disulfide reductase [Kofleriaceae bacterium]
MSGPPWLVRVGLAVAAPRAALALADDPAQPGRAGSDLVRVLVLVVLAAHTRRLVGAVWLGAVGGWQLAVDGVLAALTQALTLTLAFVVVVAAVLFATTGRHRALGRAFDAACVAALPLALVELAGAAAVLASAAPVMGTARVVLASLAFAAGGALAALAWQGLRRAAAGPSELPAPVHGRGRAAGLAVLVAAALALAGQLVWIVGNADLLRPLAAGAPAPALVAPTVGPGGALGPRQDLTALRGKVVVIDFWATWCGPCLKALPSLAATQRRYAGRGVEVLAVNVDDPAEARAIIDATAAGVPLLFDDDGAAPRWGVRSYPHTVVVDGAGRVRVVHRGGDTAWLGPAIERVLAAGP